MTKPPSTTLWAHAPGTGKSMDETTADSGFPAVTGFSPPARDTTGSVRPGVEPGNDPRNDVPPPEWLTAQSATEPISLPAAMLHREHTPPGTAVRPLSPHRKRRTPATKRRSSGQRRLGITLLVLSVCVAVGTLGGTYFRLWQGETAIRASVSSHAQFDSPVAPRATLAARGIAGAAGTRVLTGTSDTGSVTPVAGDAASPVQLAPPTTNIAPPPIAPIQSPGSIASQSGAAATRLPVPTRVTIPAIGVNTDIVEVGLSPTVVDGQNVSVWDVAAYAVGHHFSSGNPGEGENVVLSGHDDWQGEVFRDLYKLKNGDKIIVQTSAKTWSYHVETRFALQEIGASLDQRLDNAVFIGATGDERLTLITCWPYSVDDHRLIVIARPD